MRVQETFVVPESPATLWDVLEQPVRVARCIPGVEDIHVIDADNSRLRVTQSLGPMSATFDLKMCITERQHQSALLFTTIGRSVGGAAGNLRATNALRLEPLDNDHTRVTLESDLALGGMLGSLGHKVVTKQASKITQSFVQALQSELHPGAVPSEPTPAEISAPQPPTTAATAPPSPRAVAAPSVITDILHSALPIPLPVVLAVTFAGGFLAGRIRSGRR